MIRVCMPRFGRRLRMGWESMVLVKEGKRVDPTVTKRVFGLEWVMVWERDGMYLVDGVWEVFQNSCRDLVFPISDFRFPNSSCTSIHTTSHTTLRATTLTQRISDLPSSRDLI
jgi:hypothetical protein